MTNRGSYEARHMLCYKQSGASKRLLGILESYQARHYINDTRWIEMFRDRLSILTTCKSLREEALEVFYSTNTFSFGDNGSFNTFNRCITPGRAALIRKIELSATTGYNAELAFSGMFLSTDMQSDWILHIAHPKDETAIQKLEKLAHVTDISLQLEDEGPIIGKRPELWEQAREWRHLRLQSSLDLAFLGIGLLGSLKRVKVHIVCLKAWWDQEPDLQAQEDYELNKDALRAIEDDFVGKFLAFRVN